MEIEDCEFWIRSKQLEIVKILEEFHGLCDRNIIASKFEESCGLPFDISQAKKSFGVIEEKVQEIRNLLHPV